MLQQRHTLINVFRLLRRKSVRVRNAETKVEIADACHIPRDEMPNHTSRALAEDVTHVVSVHKTLRRKEQ